MHDLLRLLLLVPNLMTQPGPALASLKDNHRALLLFAASEQDPFYLQQRMTLAAHTSEMQDRDLVVISVLGKPEHDEQQTELRRRFHVRPGEFTLILVGKDGGEKLRRHTPLSAEQLEQTIDAMPMRRDEIRQKP